MTLQKCCQIQTPDLWFLLLIDLCFHLKEIRLWKFQSFSYLNVSSYYILTPLVNPQLFWILKLPLSFQCAIWTGTRWCSKSYWSFQPLQIPVSNFSRSTQSNCIQHLGCHCCQTLTLCHLSPLLCFSESSEAATEKKKNNIWEFWKLQSDFYTLVALYWTRNYLPGIDFDFRRILTCSRIALQKIVQCLCYTVDGSIHPKGFALYHKVRHQANISRWQVPALWAWIGRIIGVLRQRACVCTLFTQFV